MLVASMNLIPIRTIEKLCVQRRVCPKRFRPTIVRDAFDFTEDSRSDTPPACCRRDVTGAELIILKEEAANAYDLAIQFRHQSEFLFRVGTDNLNMLLCNRQRRPCLNHVRWIAVRRQFAHGSVMHFKKRTSVLGTHLSDGQGKRLHGRRTFGVLGLRRTRHPTVTRPISRARDFSSYFQADRS
jgi:hypothetical protein